MTKIVLPLMIVCLSVAMVHAQDSRWGISASIGPAFPVGKFGSKNIYDSTASFAQLGPALNISGSYNITQRVGVALLLTGQGNSVDTRTMDKKWEEASPGTLVNASSGNWYIGKIMAGVFVNIPLDKNQKFYLTARIMAGVLKTSAPTFAVAQVTHFNDTLNIGNPQTTASYSEHSKISLPWEFAYLAGLGVQYNMYKKFFLICHTDYSAASTHFYRMYYSNTSSGISLINIPPGNPPPATPMPYPRQPIASLNFSVGAGIGF